MTQQSLVPLKMPANAQLGSVRLQRKCACEESGTTCARCASEKRPLQRKAINGETLDGVPPIVNDVLASAGQPLDREIRRFMEGGFGRDFSTVRIHTDLGAQESARQVNAAAYTVGENVVFGAPGFRARNGEGAALLAHELAHVIQQRGAPGAVEPSNDLLERDADSAAQSVLDSGRGAIHEASGQRLSRMTSEEAQKKLWGLVPAVVKPFARPLASQARTAIDSVVPPHAELPTPVETVVNKAVAVAETARDVVAPTPISTPAPPPAAAAPEAPPTAAPAPKKPTLSERIGGVTKGRLRDKVMSNLGAVKGILLEGTNIIDSVVWVSHAGTQLAEAGIGKAADVTGASQETRAKALYAYRTYFSSYSGLHDAAKNSGWVDEVTGSISVSGKFSAAFDALAESIDEKGFSDVPEEQGAMFTSYEIGELEGAIGSQVALGFVGVEEVQLALKALSVIGTAKQIVEAVQANPKAWQSDERFWVGILNAALTVIGLRQTKAAARLSKFLIAAGSLGNAVPIVLKLVEHYTDPQLKNDPAKRDRLLAQDYGALVKVVANAIMSVVHQARTSGKKPGSILDEADRLALPTKQTGPAGPPHEELSPPATTATTATAEVDLVPAPKQKELPTAVTTPVKTTTDVGVVPKPAPKQVQTPANAGPPTKHLTADLEGISAVKPGDRTHEASKATAAQKPTELDESRKLADERKAGKDVPHEERVLAKESGKGGHEIEVRPDGVHVCSPAPCPVLHIEYAAEIVGSEALQRRVKTLDMLRKTDPKKAAAEAKKLQEVLEGIRERATPKPGQLEDEFQGFLGAVAEEGGGPIELNIGKKRAADIAAGKKDFPIDAPLGIDVDEPLPVGARGLKPQRALARALDKQNRQLLDPNTNRRTKYLGIDPKDIERNRAPLEPVSAADQPSAVITHRFGEVTELSAVFDEAVARVGDNRRMSPGTVKKRVNEEIRNILNVNMKRVQDGKAPVLVDGKVPPGYIVAKALHSLGFEFVPGRGIVAVKQNQSSSQAP